MRKLKIERHRLKTNFAWSHHKFPKVKHLFISHYQRPHPHIFFHFKKSSKLRELWLIFTYVRKKFIPKLNLIDGMVSYHQDFQSWFSQKVFFKICNSMWCTWQWTILIFVHFQPMQAANSDYTAWVKIKL